MTKQLNVICYNFIKMEFKNIFYYFCCCFFSEPDKQEKQDNYITYNDIYQRNNYDTSILDYTTST